MPSRPRRTNAAVGVEKSSVRRSLVLGRLGSVGCELDVIGVSFSSRRGASWIRVNHLPVRARACVGAVAFV